MSGRNLGLSAFLVAVFLGFWSPLASAQKFHLEEATIVDIHRAIMARQINATQLVNLYLKRIEAYNGTCVKGAVDPAAAQGRGNHPRQGEYGRVCLRRPQHVRWRDL